MEKSSSKANRYTKIIETIFFEKYRKGDSHIPFKRDEFISVADKLNVKLPKNLGDIIYSFRFRVDLPIQVLETQPPGYEWLIKLEGKGLYSFSLEKELKIVPNSSLIQTKILDATPEIIKLYSLTDEQALLAILRYNRLIDIFLGITCYSLQNHLRTSVKNIGQIETDEIYIGVNSNGVQFAIPVQAKGGTDKQGKVQIEQDIALCEDKFPDLICRPVAAQFMPNGTIALFAFEIDSEKELRISLEKHYQLVQKDELSAEEVNRYRIMRNT
ncbi:MAG: hypothetical protein R2824_25820 [Saprospiraceae bacterium]|nr:hypothetical protein [Lewinella sp.]